MKIVDENMWKYSKEKDTKILVTTNNGIRNDGKLVMGIGSAREACIRYPGIDLIFGRIVAASRREYNLIISPNIPVGAFQTKFEWRKDAPIELVMRSLQKLGVWLGNNEGIAIRMPLPGVGYGRIDPEVMVAHIKQAFAAWPAGLKDRITFHYQGTPF